MSDENVARFQAAVAAFNQRDGGKFDQLLAPDAEIVPVRAAIEGTTYRGRNAASQYVAAVDDSWESLRWELDEVRKAGDFVLGLGHIRGRGRGTGATIDTSGGWVAQFRGGLMTRFRTCTSREEALQAAGLSE
jgi:ketosteroid isomerase-like protein